MRGSRRTRARLLLTCEHAGNAVPREYERLFIGARRALASHRGWDAGALDLARALGRRLRVPVRWVCWSRLLVDPNRSPTNPRIWSRWTASLSRAEKARILDRYWWPHRRAVETAVRTAAASGARVLHVAVHSFTPVLDGRTRNADIGLLYDPARELERGLCRAWRADLRTSLPDHRVRRNYPYRGATDGLASWMRRRFPDRSYVGIELEVNQALRGRTADDDLADVLADFLARRRRSRGAGT